MNNYSYRVLIVVWLLLATACSTSEYESTHDSASFPSEQSLGDITLAFDKSTIEKRPELRASFSRKVLKSDIDFAGTYIFSLPYPSVEVAEDYFSIVLNGEVVNARAWRFKIPRKAWWGEPAGITVRYLSSARQMQLLVFEAREAENCLAEYSLEDEEGNVVSVSASLRDGLCLLPCSPPLYPYHFCGNRWSPLKR